MLVVKKPFYNALTRTYRSHRAHGFGMIEVIVVMAILAIVAVAGLPTFIDLYQRYHLSTTAQQLAYTLQYAKSSAIKNNQTVYVVFQTGDNWCYGVNAGATCNCSVANSCGLGSANATKLQDLSLSLSSISSPIQFDGVTGATLNGGVIYFTIYGQTPAIGVKVSSLGNVRLCSSNISGYSACT